MKITQFYNKEWIRLGIIDTHSLMPWDFKGDMIDFIKKRPNCAPSGKAIALNSIKLAPPVSRPSKIVAID